MGDLLDASVTIGHEKTVRRRPAQASLVDWTGLAFVCTGLLSVTASLWLTDAVLPLVSESLLIPGGKLGDVIGARRTFVLGMRCSRPVASSAVSPRASRGSFSAEWSRPSATP
jgi:hypothetical protein